MDEQKRSKGDDYEHPEEILDEMSADLDAVHEDLGEFTQTVSYTKQSIENNREKWAQMGSSLADHPEAAHLYASAVNSLSIMRDGIKDLRAYP